MFSVLHSRFQDFRLGGWGGGRSSVLTLFVDILSPQYIVVQRGLYFDFARLWPLLIVLKLY